MLYLGRESGMNMEEENPIIQYLPRYGSYFALKFAFRAVSIPGGFEELQSVTIKFLQRKQQVRYICQAIHDSQLMLSLFFSLRLLLLLYHIPTYLETSPSLHNPSRFRSPFNSIPSMPRLISQ